MHGLVCGISKANNITSSFTRLVTSRTKQRRKAGRGTGNEAILRLHE